MNMQGKRYIWRHADDVAVKDMVTNVYQPRSGRKTNTTTCTYYVGAASPPAAPRPEMCTLRCR